ncbi:MAG: phage tail tip lysozyme [Candidatus Izemoplasmatales bacterium]|nr:phage tail tip lysozyme [Candidatus Izemoplasmatales bacterium]
MANMIQYTRNLTKSVKYSAIDVMKGMNPVITSFYETNEGIFKETYKAIKDIKGTASGVYSKTIDSEVGGLAKTYLDNLKSDLKSGNFYNKERMKEYEDEAGREMFGDLDFGLDNDDIFVNDGSDINISSSPSAESGLDFNDLDTVAEKSTNAIGNLMARTAQYQVEAQRQSTKTILDQNAAIFGRLHSSMGAVNTNIGMIIDYMKENTTTHYKNSRDYYENSSKMHQETNELLKELVELEKNRYAKKKTSYGNNKKEFSDLFTDGALNLQAYGELIKQNMSETSGGMLDMFKDLLSQGSLKSMIAEAPLRGLTDGLIKTVLPKVLKESMSELNKSIEGAFGSAIMKITGLDDSSNGLLRGIANMLGFKGGLKRSINTSGYEKGAVPFDGVTRKAIIDVIPTYLSKIYTALSGKEERRFNYDTGKYVKISELREELGRVFQNESYYANSDMRRAFEDMKKSVSFKGDKKRESDFDKDMQKFFNYYFKNAKLFDKKRGTKAYGMSGEFSDENLKILTQMWEKLPKSMRLQFAGNNQMGRDSYNRRLKSIEEDSMNPVLSLFNGMYDEDDLKAVAQQVTSKKSSKTGRRSRGTNKNTKGSATSSSKKSSGLTIDEETANKIAQDVFKYNLIDYSDVGSMTGEMLDYSDSFYKTKAGKKLGKPMGMLSGIIDKVNGHIYSFIFGDEKKKNKKDAKGEEKGFIKTVFDKMEESFKSFNDWMKENIFNPIRGKFSKENVKNAANKFFGMFGIDLDTMIDKTRSFFFGDKDQNKGILGGFVQEVKKEFKGVGSYIKNAFTGVFDYFGIRGKKNKQGRAKDQYRKSSKKARMDMEKGLRSEPENDDLIFEIYNQLQKDRRGYNKTIQGMADVKESSIGNAAKGLDRVTKTGIIAVSEGEMIIPPDLNPFNIAKREKNENKAKKKFMKSILNFNDGGIWLPESAKRRINKEKASQSNNVDQSIIDAAHKEAIVEEVRRSAFNGPKSSKDDYVEGEESLFWKMKDEMNKFIEQTSSMREALFGKVKDKIGQDTSDNVKEAISDVMENIKEYAPGMTTGGVIGAGASLITGAIGGPLLGAAAGAAISLIKDSDRVRNLLFGEQKDGQYQGGLLSKDLSNNFNKYAPDMGKGATVGAITSILPFVPGGPIAGVILGSAIGFAKNNDNIKEALFGEDGKLKGLPEQLKKKLPKMGLGAIAGFLGGPFGVATNVFLGSALGFASDTDKFKDILFGYEGFDGKRAGGIFGIVKNILEVPLNGMKKFFDDSIKWFKDKIFSPLQEAAKPFKQQFKNMGNWIGDKIKTSFDTHIMKPIGDTIKKIVQPLQKGIGKLISVPLNMVKGVVSAPFKAVGAMGRSLRRGQLSKSGKAGGVASGRILERANIDASRKFRGPKLTGSDANRSDMLLDSLDEEQLLEMQAAAKRLDPRLGKKGSVLKIAEEAAKSLNLDKYLLSHQNRGDISDHDRKEIMKEVMRGEWKGAVNIIEGNPRMADYKDQAIKLIKDSAERRNKSFEAASKANVLRQQIQKRTGVDISNLGFQRDLESEVKGRVSTGEGYEKAKEAMADINSPKAWNVELKLDEKHKDIMGTLKNIDDSLYVIAFPNSDKAKKDKAQKDTKTKAAEDKEPTKAESTSIFNKFANVDPEGFMDASYEALDESEFAAGAKPSILARMSGRIHGIKDKLKAKLGIKRAAKSNETDKDDPNVKWDMSQGSPMKYIRGRDGGWHEDKSNTETVQTKKRLKEAHETQGGIFENIKSLPGRIFSFFGGKNAEEGSSDGEGIFAKILKTAGKAAFFGSLIAFAPKIGGFIKDKILPIFTDLKDGFLSGWKHTGEVMETLPEKIGHFFGNHLNNGVTYLGDFFSGTGHFEGKGFPYLLNDKILPNLLTGFEYMMGNVAPKVVEIIISNLPQILMSAIKGVGGFLKGLFGNNKEDRKVDYSSNKGQKTDIKNIAVNKPKDLNYEVSGSWKTSGTNITTNTTSSSSTSSDNSGTTQATAKTSSYISSNRRNNSGAIRQNLPKAFGYTNETMQQNALESYNQVKDNVVTIDGYGEMTISELLNRDDVVIGTDIDSDGTEYVVTGADILNYPDIAAELGLDSSISYDQQLENSKGVLGTAYGRGEWSTSKRVAGAMGRAVISGRTGGIANGLIKFGSKMAKKNAKKVTGGLFKGGFIRKRMFRGAKSMLGAGMAGVGESINAAGNFGAKHMPSGLVGSKNIAKAEDYVSLTSRAANKVKNSKAVQKIQKFGSKIADTTLGKKMSEIGKKGLGKVQSKIAKTTSKANKGLIGKLIKKITDTVPKIFKDSKVVKIVQRAAKGLSKESVEKTLQNFSKSLVTKVTANLGKTAGKLVGKAAAKVTALVGTAGIATIAFAVIGFISGWRKADEYMNIKEPTFVQKLISGAISMLNDTFLFGLLPLDTLFEWAINIAENIPFFKDAVADIREQQSELAKEVEDYNIKNGTNLNVDEYLAKDKIGTKIKNAIFHPIKTLRGDFKNSGQGNVSSDTSSVETMEVYNPTDVATEAISTNYQTTDGSYDSSSTTSMTGGNATRDDVNSNVASAWGYNYNPTNTDTTGSNTGSESSNVYNDATYNETGEETVTPAGLLEEATEQMIYNSESSMINMMFSLNEALPIIDAEHENTKTNVEKTDLENYWKVKSEINTDTIGGKLAHFLTMYEKALMLPIVLLNNMISLSSETLAGVDNTYSGSTNENFGQAAYTASAGNTLLSRGSTLVSSVAKKRESNIKKTIRGAVGLGASIFNGIKSFFGKGTDLEESDAPIPKEYIDRPITEYQDPQEQRELRKKEYFVSQIDSPYSRQRFSIPGDTDIETVSDAGCAPAAATMAINLANKRGMTYKKETFGKAIKKALPFKAKDDGVTADYFIQQFADNGLSSAFISAGNPNSKEAVIDLLMRDRPVVLIGQNPGNTSKKNSPFGSNGHYIVATGMSPDGRYIYVNDPESKKANMMYPTEEILSSVTFGVAPVPKNKRLDARLAGSGIMKYLNAYRGQATAGKNNREKVWNYCRSKGLSEAAAAGIIGNLAVESGSPEIKLNAVEKGSGGGIGMVQWSGGRKTRFKEYCNSRGVSWENSDVDIQLDFMFQEIDSGAQWIWPSGGKYVGRDYPAKYNITFQQFKTTNDIDMATTAFCAKFERPFSDKAGLSNRLKHANDAFKEFTGKAVTGGEASVNFHKFTGLPESTYRGIANIAVHEQGSSIEGVKAEVSMLANRAELYSGNDLEKQAKSGWFAKGAQRFNNASGVSQDAVKWTKEVLVDGKRTLPMYIDEHDSVLDIASASGVSNIRDYTQYKQHETVIKNTLGSTYNYYSHPVKANGTDPFGYIGQDKRQKYGEGYYDVNGNAIGITSNESSSATGTTVSTESSWKNPKTILDIFSIVDDLAKAYGLNVGDDTNGETITEDKDGTTSSSGYKDAGSVSEQQQKLVDIMKNSEKTVKYSQPQRSNFKIENDKMVPTSNGYGSDCSSTVQGIYKHVTGVDVGSYTGAQLDNPNTTLIEDHNVGEKKIGPTISKLQLGDIILYGRPKGHVEMYVGDGRTMGQSGPTGAPGPFYAATEEVDGHINGGSANGHGYAQTRRLNQFMTGKGSGLLSKGIKSTSKAIKSIAGRGYQSSSRVGRLINKFSGGFSGKGSGIGSSLKDYSASNTNTYSATPYYNYTTSKSTSGDNIYETAVVNNNTSVSQTSNSEVLLVMLKTVIQLLVKLVDNSDNMKQIVTLLSQLVATVSTTNDNVAPKDRKAQSSALKMNLLNAINNSTQSNPDKELLDIINNMELLASQ